MNQKKDESTAIPPVTIKGLLSQVHQFNSQNGIILTSLIIIPAADKFSNPVKVSVRSNSPLGQEGEEITVICDVRTRYWKNNEGLVNYDPQFWQAA